MSHNDAQSLEIMSQMEETLIACNLRPKVRQRAARTCNLSSAGPASPSPHSYVGLFCLRISLLHTNSVLLTLGKHSSYELQITSCDLHTHLLLALASLISIVPSC